LSEPIIDGNRVYIEDNKCRIEAYPHTTSGGWVNFKVISKVYTGNIDFALGFDKDLVSLKKAQLYNPRTVTIHREYIIPEEWFNNSNWKIEYTYSSKRGNIVYSGNLKIWKYANDPDVGEWDLVYDINFTEFDTKTKTVHWQEIEERIWEDLANKLTWKLLNQEHDGLDRWYYTSVNVKQNVEYYIRVWFDVKPVGGVNTTSKYGVAIKPSSETLTEAITNNHLYYLDPWYNNSWQHRKSHTIVGSTAGSQTNYQIKIVVHYGSGTDSGENVYLNGKCRTDFGDIRFTKSDGSTLLDYWMEEYTASTSATFWVKIDNIPASPSTVTIYIYYGNSSAITTSNGDNTFLFFDDFEDGTIDTAKWTVVGSGISETGGHLVITSSTAQQRKLRGRTTYAMFGPNKRVRVRSYKTAGNIFMVLAALYDEEAGGGGNDILSWQHGVSYNTFQSRTKNDGTSNLKTLGYTDTNWHVWEILWSSAPKAYFYLDDILKTTHTSYVPTTADNDLTFELFVGNHLSGVQLHLDWCFVAKYVDPEPTHGSWGSEETLPIWKIYGLTNLSKIMGILLSNVSKINSVQ